MTHPGEPNIPHYGQAGYVNPQITDSVTQANVAALSISPAVSAMQSYLSLSQAQGVLFANMVNNQQQLAMAGQVAVVEGIIQLFGLNKGPTGPLVSNSGGKRSEPAAGEETTIIC
jgi:hypothetical protein